jgi:hypothetical protein
MKLFRSLFLVCIVFLGINSATAQTNAEQELIQLSKDKWKWTSEKNVDQLSKLFDDKAKFVHMSGSWKKAEEIDIIKTGRIWYRNTDVHDVAAEVFDDTAVLWSRITLEANVRGTEAKNEFTVTEVFRKQNGTWKILALTFSSVRDTHKIEH